MTISGDMVGEARRFATAPDPQRPQGKYEAILHPATLSDIGITAQQFGVGELSDTAGIVIDTTYSNVRDDWTRK